MRMPIAWRVLPVMYTQEQPAGALSHSCQFTEIDRVKAERLFDYGVDASLEHQSRCCSMKCRRTGNIDKVERLSIEHQFEVVINADTLDKTDCMMAPRSRRIMNG